jgi:hypothetical protein
MCLILLPVLQSKKIASPADPTKREGLMKKAPVGEETVLWLLGGAGMALAIWQYYTMVMEAI